jgi:hypothetical protein
MPMFFYTYYSYEPYGRGYIGSRGSSVEPSVDFYMGSYTDETFNPTEKIIISIHETREDAHLAEIKLHEFFSVGENPHFANKVKSTKVGLCSYGMVRVNNGIEEKLVHKNQIPNGWVKGRLRDLSTYINTSKKYLNDRRRGDGYKVFLEDINKNPSILDIPIRKLGKMYGTSHTSISRWKKSRSFILYSQIENANAD